MNIYVMGDAPMVEAFELIGMEGRVVERGQDVGALLDEWAGQQPETLVLLQSGLAETLSDECLDRLARRSGCLVLEAPSVGEAAPDSADFLRSVHMAIGAVR